MEDYSLRAWWCQKSGKNLERLEEEERWNAMCLRWTLGEDWGQKVQKACGGREGLTSLLFPHVVTISIILLWGNSIIDCSCVASFWRSWNKLKFVGLVQLNPILILNIQQLPKKDLETKDLEKVEVHFVSVYANYANCCWFRKKRYSVRSRPGCAGTSACVYTSRTDPGCS